MPVKPVKLNGEFDRFLVKQNVTAEDELIFQTQYKKPIAYYWDTLNGNFRLTGADWGRKSFIDDHYPKQPSSGEQLEDYIASRHGEELAAVVTKLPMVNSDPLVNMAVNDSLKGSPLNKKFRYTVRCTNDYEPYNLWGFHKVGYIMWPFGISKVERVMSYDVDLLTSGIRIVNYDMKLTLVKKAVKEMLTVDITPILNGEGWNDNTQEYYEALSTVRNKYREFER